MDIQSEASKLAARLAYEEFGSWTAVRKAAVSIGDIYAYGASMNVSRTEVKSLLDAHFSRFPDLTTSPYDHLDQVYTAIRRLADKDPDETVLYQPACNGCGKTHHILYGKKYVCVSEFSRTGNRVVRSALTGLPL